MTDTPDIKQRLQFTITKGSVNADNLNYHLPLTLADGVALLDRVTELERQLAQAEHNTDSAIADAREAEDRAEQAERQLAEQRVAGEAMANALDKSQVVNRNVLIWSWERAAKDVSFLDLENVATRLRTERSWCYDSGDQAFQYVTPELADEAAEMLDRVDRTADGVPLFGMTAVWVLDRGQPKKVLWHGVAADEICVERETDRWEIDYRRTWNRFNCYSTRDAAIHARDNQ